MVRPVARKAASGPSRCRPTYSLNDRPEASALRRNSSSWRDASCSEPPSRCSYSWMKRGTCETANPTRTANAIAVSSRSARMSDQQPLERAEPVGLLGRLVPADAADAGKAHRQPGAVPARAMHGIERDLEHQPGLDLAHRAEAVDRVVAHPLVELTELGVGKAEIRLAHRDQLPLAPAAESIVRVIGRALAVASPSVHQHAVERQRPALPLEPGALGAAGDVGAVGPL